MADHAAVFKLHDVCELFCVEAVGVDNRAVGVGHRKRFCAELNELFDSVLRNISGAGYENILAFDRVALCCEHFLGAVYVAVASRFGTNQASAPFEALAGENAVIGIFAAFVLAKEVAYFAAAHTDVAGGNVSIGTDVAIELAHEGVAEIADFVVAFSLGIEVGTAFAAAHGQSREGVLKYLFKTEEF